MKRIVAERRGAVSERGMGPLKREKIVFGIVRWREARFFETVSSSLERESMG